MKHNFPAPFSRVIARSQVALLCLLLIAHAAQAQDNKPAAKPAPANTTVPVLLVSDIHFEPFWDPDKVSKLNAATVDKWDSILAPPASAGRKQTFDAFLQKCGCGDGDTSSVLFDASLKAMKDNASGAAFVTVSGDLISHQFKKKYFTAIPGASDTDYHAFVEKTIQYVVDKLDAQFPKALVYVALGNNDSDCDDYLIDEGSPFLKETALEVAKNFPTAERKKAEETFGDEGYYSVALPAPIKNARLLVLDDLFMSKNYRTCAGHRDPSAATAQIKWLAQRLADARAANQKLWIMGHIPPGIDLYSTARKGINVCTGGDPVMFLSSEEMPDAIAPYGDVVQLAIFAHTHMDELRLLKDQSAGAPSKPPVPIKMVSSISPIHNNLPSITVAQVDPATAAVVDYHVFSSPDLTGDSNAKWKGYDFGQSYKLAAFSSSTLSQLIAAFAADPGGTTQDSKNYIGDFSAGHSSGTLRLAWPQYVCSLSNHTKQTFKACVCANTH
jgi:sphingomyelin phosphodiesterase acid-like 3